MAFAVCAAPQHAVAQGENYESLYQSALILERDGKNAEAIQTFRRAAGAGSAAAALRLADAYIRGGSLGVSRNLAEAAQWYQTAGQLGVDVNAVMQKRRRTREQPAAGVQDAPPPATAPATPPSALVAMPLSVAFASEANQTIAARLTRAFACSEKLWPGWPVATLQLLLVDVAKKNAVLLRGAGASPNLEAVPYETVPEQFKQPKLGFAFTRWPGVAQGQIVALFHSAADETAIVRAVHLALHEGFHLTGQRQFARGPGNSSVPKGERYPENVAVRYLRREIMRSLSRASSGESLGAAAHWANVLSMRGDAEELHFNDRIEGSAEYVAMLGLSIAREGCDAGNERLAAGALEFASVIWGPWTEAIRPNVDGEAIIIGTHAGLRLFLSGHAGWQQAVAKGETIQEVLLQSIAPVKQPDDAKLAKLMEEAIAPRNALNRRRVEELNAALLSSAHAVLSFSALQLGSAVAPTGLLTYLTRDGQNVLMIPDARASPLLGGDGGRLVLEGKNVRFEDRTPCGPSRQVIFPVPREAVTQLDGDRASISHQGVTGTNIKVVPQDRAGVRWLCIQGG